MASNVESSVGVVWGLLRRLAILGISVYFLYRVQTILVSVIVAVLLTYALLPGVEWLCRRRIHAVTPKTQRLIATIIVFCCFFGLVALSIGLFVSPFKQEISYFSKHFGAYTDQIGGYLSRLGELYSKAVPADVKEVIGQLDYSRVVGWFSGVVSRALNVTTSWIGFALELVLIPVLAFYFVLDYRTLTREIYGLVPRGRLKDAVRIGRDTGEILQSYVIGQFILCVIAGLLTGAFLSLMSVPYVVVLALFAGITRAIPVIGPVVSGVPIVLVGLLYSDGSMALPLYLLSFVIIIHFAESKFIMPRLIGDRMHLHPAVVIIVLLIGAEFFGLMGMFLAAPVAAVVRDLLRIYYIRPRRRMQRIMCKEEEPPLIRTQSVG